MTTTRWCGECHARRVVMDEHEEEYPTGASHSYTTRWVGLWVTDLACGHHIQEHTSDRSERDPGA